LSSKIRPAAETRDRDAFDVRPSTTLPPKLAPSQSAKRLIQLLPEADRVLIVGSTGDGKSTVAKHIVEDFQPCRLLICDSKGEIKWPGAVLVQTPEQITQALSNQQTIRWVPATFEKKYLEECWKAIHAARGPLIVWIDEAAEHCKPGWCPTGMRLDITQGRSGDSSCGPRLVITCTQRLAECHPAVRTQAEHIMVMTPPPAEIDLKAIAAHVRRSPQQLEAELQQLYDRYGRYSHLWYCKLENDMRNMAPIPL